jgi:hypothetical protein
MVGPVGQTNGLDAAGMVLVGARSRMPAKVSCCGAPVKIPTSRSEAGFDDLIAFRPR